MENKDNDQSGPKSRKSSMLLTKSRSRQSSLERQNDARALQHNSRRALNGSDLQPEDIPAGQLDPAIVTTHKKKVHQLRDIEKCHAGLLKTIQYLEEQLASDAIPVGLHIKRLKAKGKDDGLQVKFDEKVQRSLKPVLENNQ